MTIVVHLSQYVSSKRQIVAYTVLPPRSVLSIVKNRHRTPIPENSAKTLLHPHLWQLIELLETSVLLLYPSSELPTMMLYHGDSEQFQDDRVLVFVDEYAALAFPVPLIESTSFDGRRALQAHPGSSRHLDDPCPTP